MINKPLVYAVDDEESIRELYECALENSGFSVVCFENSDTLFEALKAKRPDIFLLDIMLSGMDGYEILSQLKKDKDTMQIPIILISAKGEELSKVKGLNLGADDYIEKPFGVMELAARINANLRKTILSESLKTQYKDISIDDSTYEVTIANKIEPLTLKAYELLKFLVSKAGSVVSREDLLNSIWGFNYLETRTLDMHIASLRKALVNSKVEIKTIRGVGYLLK